MAIAPGFTSEGSFFSRDLPGGLEAWVWRRPGYQNKHASLSTRFGAMDALFEVGGKTFEVPDGTAHFLEHMAFETDKGSALGLFSRLGVQGNAFTSHAVTSYYFSGTDNFWPALRQLVRLVVSTRLTSRGVESEKRIIAQEIRMYEDSSEAKLLENLLRALYVRHPIRRRIAGTLASIADITPEVLLRCHATFYHPSNLVFVAAGDLDPERVFDTVAGELVKLGEHHPGPAFRRLFPEEPERPDAERVTARMPVKRPSFLLGFKDPPVTPPAGAAAAPASDLLRREIAVNIVVEVLLGPTSPLYDDLYRDGLVDTSFSTRYTSGETFGHVTAGGTTRDVDRVSNLLLEGISSWRRKGVDRPDLERKRRKAYGQYLGLADSLDGLATLFVLYRLKGVDLRSYPDVLGRVTEEEVNGALRELFVPERAAVSAVSPATPSDVTDRAAQENRTP